MNLLQKLLLPTALLFILIFVVLILTFKHFLELNNKKNISNDIELSYSAINNNLNNSLMKLLLIQLCIQ